MIILIILSIVISIGVIVYCIRKEQIEENESYLLGYQSSRRQIAESGGAVPYLMPKDAFEAGWNHGIDKSKETIERAEDH